MPNALITHLQIFLIGFSFGIAGPCLVSCSPILLTYVAGSRKPVASALRDIFVFLTGRFTAYIVLGCLAGMSGALLRNFAGSLPVSFFRPLAGAVVIFFGVMILFDKGYSSCPAAPPLDQCSGRRPEHSRRTPGRRAYNFGGLFALGLAVGMAPCAPLLALLFEIALMSKGALDGIAYASSFGIGTFLSGFAVIGAAAGVLSWLPAKMLKSKESSLIFRAACGTILIALGAVLIAGRAY
jgi:sulfite exporter TauE/SafE